MRAAAGDGDQIGRVVGTYDAKNCMRDVIGRRASLSGIFPQIATALADILLRWARDNY